MNPSRFPVETAAIVLISLATSLAAASETPYVEKLKTEHVAALFPKNARTNVSTNWPLVKAELKQYGLADSKALIVYALATIRVETGRFSPTPELPSTYSKTIDKAGYAGIRDPGTERPFGAYDSSITYGRDGRPLINKHLGNCLYTGKDEMLMRQRHGMPPRPTCDDGERFRGRGFIQITGRYNYERMQKGLNGRIQIDLVSNPESAGTPEIAAKILAIYLAERRGDIERAMAAKDYVAARKIVNTAALGMDVFRDVVSETDRMFP